MPEQFARDAEARAAQAVCIKESRVISDGPAAAFASDRIPAVVTCQCAQKDRGVRDCARHWTRRVLACRDGNDAGAADQTERGLDADDAAVGGRRNDGAVRFGAY